MNRLEKAGIFTSSLLSGGDYAAVLSANLRFIKRMILASMGGEFWAIELPHFWILIFCLFRILCLWY